MTLPLLASCSTVWAEYVQFSFNKWIDSQKSQYVSIVQSSLLSQKIKGNEFPRDTSPLKCYYPKPLSVHWVKTEVGMKKKSWSTCREQKGWWLTLTIMHSRANTESLWHLCTERELAGEGWFECTAMKVKRPDSRSELMSGHICTNKTQRHLFKTSFCLTYFKSL